MKTSWLCATLLPLFLFSSAVPEKPCHWNDNFPEIQRVPVHSNVSVPCPMFTGQEMMFTLHKGQKNLGSITIQENISNMSSSKDLGSKITLYVNISDNITCFVLCNVTMDATALYTCTAEKSFPPPLVPIMEKPQTIVIVENHGCAKNPKTNDASDNHLLLWVGFGVLGIYGLIITCIALSLRFRLKTEDMTTHDYMNMKPRTRWRKQGINHPTHLSWYNDTANGLAASKKLVSKGTSV